MDWHSIFRKKGMRGVPVAGLACCWLLLNAVAAEGESKDVTDSPARQQRSVTHVSVDLLGAGGDRQWASDPQWGVPAFTGIARQPVRDSNQNALEPAQQPIAPLKGAPVIWRF
ncbi:hypothetical protein [Azotobacter armeniacus]